MQWKLKLYLAALGGMLLGYVILAGAVVDLYFHK